LNYDFDLVASDPSDANTNSATFFSDDTDDKSKRSNNPEAGISIQQEQAEISIQQEEVNVNCFGNYFSVDFNISMVHTLIYCFPKRHINYDGMVEIMLNNSRILFQASIATAAAVIEEHPYVHVSEYQPDVPGISDRRRTGTLLFL
jgi:hypothetical protein